MFATNGPGSDDQLFTSGHRLNLDPVCSLIHREGFFKEECGTTGLRRGGTQGGCRSPGADMRRNISETPFYDSANVAGYYFIFG